MTTPARSFRRPLAGALLLAAAALTLSPPAPGADASPKDAKNEPKEQERGKWLPVFQRHVKDYVVRVGDGKAEATRLSEPLLRWWQPIRGGDDGAVYLWVRDGRPAAAVTFFTFKWPDGRRSLVHELHSLVPEPVEAEWRGQTVLKASAPGVTFRPVADAPKPAEGAPARLRQMQAIAREFSAKTVDDKGSSWPLRVLARPLYRYEGAADGGLFALVQGTDPEAFLLLQARGEGADRRWEYAVARYTDLEIHVLRRGVEVFTGPHTLGSANGIYYSHTMVETRSDSPDDF